MPRCTQRAGKAAGENPALEVAAWFSLDVVGCPVSIAIAEKREPVAT